MYGCESWTVKKSEHRRINALNCGVEEDSLRVPWTAKRFNQSILEEISPEYSLEGLMLKLKLQDFGHMMQTTDSFERTLIAGKDWRQEEKRTTEDEMVGWHHQLDGHEIEQALGVGDGQGSLACCSPWGHKESDTTEHTHTHAYHGISRIAIAVCTWDFALYLNSFLKVTNIFKTNKTSHFRSRKDRRDHLLHTSQISNWIEGQFAMEEWKVESRIWVLFSDHHSFSVITILMVCCNNEYCSRNSLLLLHYIAISFYRFSFYHLHLGSTQNSLPDSHPYAVCDLPPWSSFSHLKEATDASHLSASSFCISPTSRITYSHHWHRAKCLELNLVFFI